jgi:hypothetical protein
VNPSLSGLTTPIRSWDLDEGPFGHYDLADSVLELTLTRIPASKEEEQALCDLVPDTTDPRTFGSGNAGGFYPGTNLLAAAAGQPPPEIVDLYWVVRSSSEALYVEGGARCAYDPMP